MTTKSTTPTTAPAPDDSIVIINGVTYTTTTHPEAAATIDFYQTVLARIERAARQEREDSVPCFPNLSLADCLNLRTLLKEKADSVVIATGKLSDPSLIAVTVEGIRSTIDRLTTAQHAARATEPATVTLVSNHAYIPNPATGKRGRPAKTLITI